MHVLEQNERRPKKGTAIAKNLRAGFPATHTDTRLHLTATHTQEKLLGRLLARANPIMIYSIQYNILTLAILVQAWLLAKNPAGRRVAGV